MNADRPASSARADGLVEVHTITYESSHDGRRVKGVVAIPRAAPSRGCLIWQSGLGSKKEHSSQAWQGFASLGLTTVSIDLRDYATRDPKAVAEVIRGLVADLRSAVDYLGERPYCRRNIAFAGISFGGIVGTLLAAEDTRVKAAVLMSTPGSLSAVLAAPGDPMLPGIASTPARRAAARRILSPLDPARFVGRISPRPVLIVSGLDDETVPISTARRLQAAARKPKTIVEYQGGHDPGSGPAAAGNGQAVASFLLRHVVEPTYEVSGDANGTFIQR